MADSRRQLTIALAGDVMTGRGIDQVLRTPSDPALHESYVRDARDYVRLAERENGWIGRELADDAIWGRLLEWLRRLRPDAFIANLETAVTTSDSPWPGKGIHYRMQPANVGCLRAAGLTLCTLANNHVLDWGQAGLAQTLHVLHGAGLRTAGAAADASAAWAPAHWTAGAGALRLLACATTSSGVPAEWAASAAGPGIALLDDLSDASAHRIAGLMSASNGAAQCKIVSIHWGGNWVERVPDAHRRFAQRLIELGAADVVHGHSSHHPMPVEAYRDRLILYGCGDLINDYEGIDPHGARRSDIACLYVATLDAASGSLAALRIVPLQVRRFRLGEPDDAVRRSLLQHLAGSTPELIAGLAAQS